MPRSTHVRLGASYPHTRFPADTVALTDARAVSTPSGVQPGWLRTAANTGIAAAGLTTGDLTTYTGGSTVTTALTRQLINMGGGQLVLANGASLTECYVTGAGGGGMDGALVRITGTNVSMTRCDVVANSSSATTEKVGVSARTGRTVNLSSIRVTGFSVPLWLNCAGTVDQWYGYNNGSNGGQASDPHEDGFTQREGSGPLTITNSRFTMNVGAAITGAVFIQPWMGAISNTTFRQCYIDGSSSGYYSMQLEACDRCTFDDNRWTGPIVYSPGTYGPVTNLTWTNNYTWANNPANAYRGSVVGSPV